MSRELKNLNSVNKHREQVEMYELIQKIGKGKRRHQLKFSKSDKKLIHSTMKQISDAITMQGNSNKNLEIFVNHIQNEITSSGKFLKLSYEELIFLRKIILSSIKELELTELKWYQVLKRFYRYIALAQYRKLLDISKI